MKKDYKFFLLVAASGVLVLLCCIVLSFSGTPAYAAKSEVISELEFDKNFSVELYPSVNNDFSFQVLTIAESSDKSLFLYVYQPSHFVKDLIATSVNISTGINDNLSYKNYKLELISTEGVFDKYLVKDFSVKDDALRYYDISSIFRVFDSEIDNSADNKNDINEVSFEIGKLFTASTVEGKVTYTCVETETIVISDKYVGFVRYSNGFWLYADKCDSHYVAFSTEKQIERLMEADVYYVSRAYSKYLSLIGGSSEEYGDPEEHYVSLIYSDVVSNPADKLFGKEYQWNRIESVSDFISKEDLTDETKDALSGKDWVLRFCETEYRYMSGTGSSLTQSTLISEVTILRLKFETEGKVYNLGVVDNKQSGDLTVPDNTNTNEIEFPDLSKADWLKWIGLIVIVFLLLPLLPFIVKVIVFVISLPFRFVKSISGAIKKKK